jgi:cardiolipin synthase (CMP-forming)
VNRTVWTIPNLLSILRLLGIPLYLYLVSEGRFSAAVLVLFVAGATDYLDGKIARRFNQTSRLGELLDPAADRLYILVILISLFDLKLIPFVVIALLITRDLVLAVLLFFMKRNGLQPFTVTYLGKAATFNLLYAFPFLLLTLSERAWLAEASFIAGWAFSSWGIGLYLYTGTRYFLQGLQQIRSIGREVDSSTH